MPPHLDSLEQLTAWETYCAFMKERLVQLPKGECSFYLSKKKLDFNEGGKSWKGHAVLVGPKADVVAKAMNKEGVQFLEGTCTADGKEFTVVGIEPSLLKLAASTLKRTKLGFKIVGAEGPDSADGLEAAPSSASASGAATTDPGLLNKRLELLSADIERAAEVATKATEPFVKQARARIKQAEALLVSNPVRAAELLQEGEEFLRQAQLGALEGGKPTEAAEIETRRQELLAALAEAKALKDPANDALLKQVEKDLGAVLTSLGKKDYARAGAQLDWIDGQLALVVEGGDPADDPDLTMLSDWAAYRKFLKAQLKRAKEGGPIFISRERQTFTIEGKEFKGHALLWGPKAKASELALKRNGILFMEGTCKVDGKDVKVAGVKKKLFVGATKTMIKLRLGKKLVPDGALLPDEDESAESAKDDPTGKKSLDKQIKEVADGLVKLRESIEKQRKAVPALEQTAKDKRKRSDELTAAARKKSDDAKDSTKDWDDAAAALQAADAAHYAAKEAGRQATRAETDLREMTERLHRIKDSPAKPKDKEAELKKLKADVAAKQLDATIANVDINDPKAGKLIADQIKKRFGVQFTLNKSKITGRDADGRQIFKDNDKKVDPAKEAEALKELYLTLAKAPVFPASHLKKLNVSLRPSNSESEGGVYYGDSKTAEITCRRPKESFDYGKQLADPGAFPDGVDENCKPANNDPVNYFDWATLHEVAHAVDAKYGFMSTTRMGQPAYGKWTEHKNDVGPIASAAVGQFGGSLSGPDQKKLTDFASKTAKAKPGKGPAPKTPEETAVKGWIDGIRVNKGLWWNGPQSKALAVGTRVYQEAYENWWISYDLEARKRGIHGYQFRAPGEWFAELYAAYYSDKLKPSHPIVPDLTKLEAPK
jgi:hypothetical protein